MSRNQPSMSVCVYCGSGFGTEPAYKKAAYMLGKALAKKEFTMVYGGGAIGLMGEAARACIDAGGHVTGIIPGFLTKPEIAFKDASELIVTKDMHERKMKMFLKSDAFVVLPGGIGTLDEVAEMLSWCQLGHHQKPIILANINDFWSPFTTLLAHMREKEFIRDGYTARYTSVNTIDEVMNLLTETAKG